MILIPFSATLNDTLTKDSGFLPLRDNDRNRLLSIIPENDEMFLTIKDGLHTEWIRAENQCGTIVLTRGIAGSEARKFPRGSCVLFETSLPLIQWLICNYDCCVDMDCPCIEIENAGVVFPAARVNYPWEGSAIFKGDLPITFGITGMPSWMTAEQGANYVRLYGTPNGAGTYTISIAGTNCSGKYVAIQSAELEVTAL